MPGTLRGSRRWLFELFVLGAVAAVIIRTWLVAGLVVPMRVSGPSMAENYRGRRFHTTCAACRFPFAWHTDRDSPPRWAVCPNCGYAENDASGLSPVPGDRIAVIRPAYAFRRPRRWENAVIRQPGSESQLAIKRIVGLPGETIELRRGNVFADGHLVQKPLATQRRTAVLVHDSRYQNEDDSPVEGVWHAAREPSGWRTSGGEYSHRATKKTPRPSTDAPTAGLLTDGDGNSRSGVDWLLFALRRQLPGQPAEQVPITNMRGYNQGRPQRAETVHPVSEVLLSVRVAQAAGEGGLYLAVTDGTDEYCVRIDQAESRAVAFRNGEQVSRPVPIRRRKGLTDGIVEFSLIDRQLLLAVDGRTIIVLPLLARENDKPTVRPLAIGCSGLEVRISRIEVFRDLYYTGADDGRARWRLGDGQYLVLGDNSVFSSDSRTWHPQALVTRSSFVGKPFRFSR